MGIERTNHMCRTMHILDVIGSVSRFSVLNMHVHEFHIVRLRYTKSFVNRLTAQCAHRLCVLCRPLLRVCSPLAIQPSVESKTPVSYQRPVVGLPAARIVIT